jgi:primosomal protein N' (replication factor Y)
MVDPLFRELHPSATATAVRVALPLPVDRLFDYAVPAELASAARAGCRVLVPFSGRRLVGVVVGSTAPASLPAGRGGSLASLEAVVDPEPALSPELVEVLREAAEAAVCPLGLALAAALPPGSSPRASAELVLSERGRRALDEGALRGPARDLLARLAAGPRPLSGLARARSDAPLLLAQLERDGLARRWTRIRAPAARGARERVLRAAPGLDLEVACRESLARAPAQAALLRRVAGAGELALASLGDEFRNAAALARALADRGLVEIDERPVARDVLGPPVPRDRPPELTGDQARALEPICRAIRERAHPTFLLHGVTGSGKTEVYLRAVQQALACGRQALVLVPEITLTHQIVARLRARFGDRLAVLHSRLRPGERLDQWERLRSGRTPIAVGARSALFAPLEHLGVIVVDEEHDSAYKNEEGFRYHARDLAALRAARAGCPLLLGSATPSLETRYACDEGDALRLVLPRRIGGRPLPAVELVDLCRERERSPRGHKLILSGPLRRALRETVAEGGQAILFLNRRGFSTQVFCFECGTAERCENCDVALVFHAAERRLRCHYCDASRPPPERCSGCGSADAALLGVGTERVEEEVRGFLPEARLARLDRDTSRRRGHAEAALAALREGRVDVLIGTQMVAKGHDFPGVRLVGVIAADLALHLPDFRAAERTFQLLTQVAGRAGRDAAPGRVVIQSFVPEHYAIAPVRDHDYERFYAEELGHRQALGYPPFGHLAQATLSGGDEAQTRRAADELAAALRESAPPGVEVLGPAPAALARLRGRHRVQILLKGPRQDAVREAARRLRVASAGLPREIQAAVDVNPASLL